MENVIVDEANIDSRAVAGLKSSGYIKTLVEDAPKEMAEEGIILEDQVSMVRNYLAERVNVLFRPISVQEFDNTTGFGDNDSTGRPYPDLE